MRRNKKMRIIAAMLTLCVGMATQPLTAVAMNSLQAQQVNAEILLEASDYVGAESESSKILQQDPNNISVYKDRAKARAEQNKFESAFQDYRNAILMMQSNSSAKQWHSDIVDIIEESANYANTNMQYGLWLKYFNDITLTTPEGQVSYGEDTLKRNKELFQQMESIYSQMPAVVREQQLLTMDGAYKANQEQKANERQAAQNRETQRQKALNDLNQSYYSERDNTTVRYGGTGIQLAENNEWEWTQLFILSQPMKSAQCSSHEMVCYVPAGTEVQQFVTGISEKTGWGYAYFGKKYTVGANETIKILDDSETTDEYYCLTLVGV